MGGCQNHDPFWGTLDTRCRTRIGIQKGVSTGSSSLHVHLDMLPEPALLDHVTTQGTLPEKSVPEVVLESCQSIRQ